MCKATKYDKKNCHKLLDILHSDKYQNNKNNKIFIRVTHFTENLKVLDRNYTNIQMIIYVHKVKNMKKIAKIT